MASDKLYINTSDMCGKLYKIGRSESAVAAGQWWFQFAVSLDKWTVTQNASTQSLNCQAKITVEVNPQIESYGHYIGESELLYFINTSYLMQGNGTYIGQFSTMTKVNDSRYEGYFDITGYANDVYINLGAPYEELIGLQNLWYDASGNPLQDKIYWNFNYEFFKAGMIEYQTPKLVLNPTQVKITSSGTIQEVQLTENANNIFINVDRGYTPTYGGFVITETIIGTNAVSATASTVFKTTDINTDNWSYRLSGSIAESVYEASSASSASHPTLIYWLDEQGGYHAKRSWAPDSDYGFDIADGGVFYDISLELGNDALTLSAVNLYKYKGATSTSSFPVFVNNSKMRMRVNMTVKFADSSLPASYSSTYSFVVKDAQETYIKQEQTISGNSWTKSFSFDSDLLAGVARTMNLQLIVTEEGYGRVITYDLGSYEVYSYEKPEITYFDAYRSDSHGTLNLNSTHITLMATWNWSQCGGNNDIASKKMSINGGSDYTMNNSNSAKIYWTNYTFTVGSDYSLTFKVTDSFGESATYTIKLSNDNILMDFNSSGVGVAIGKLSEQQCFEVAIPAIFYQNVEYINGSRSTVDAASNLGFEDNHNTGCRTIQQILDYIIAKLQ